MNWHGLAQAVIDRRVELGYRTRESFAVASGLSSRLLGDLERAERDNFDRVTISRLEHALQWRRGQALEILRSEPDNQAEADAGVFSLHPDAVAARTARLLAADSPIGKNMRWALASTIAGVLDLVDPPTPWHRQQREAEAERMFHETIRAANEAQLRERAMRQKPSAAADDRAPEVTPR